MNVQVNVTNIHLQGDPWDSVWDTRRQVWVSPSSPHQQVKIPDDQSLDGSPNLFHGYTCFPSPQSSCWDEQRNNVLSDENDEEICPYVIINSSPSKVCGGLSRDDSDNHGLNCQNIEQTISNRTEKKKSSRRSLRPSRFEGFHLSIEENEENEDELVTNNKHTSQSAPRLNGNNVFQFSDDDEPETDVLRPSCKPKTRMVAADFWPVDDRDGAPRNIEVVSTENGDFPGLSQSVNDSSMIVQEAEALVDIEETVSHEALVTSTQHQEHAMDDQEDNVAHEDRDVLPVVQEEPRTEHQSVENRGATSQTNDENTEEYISLSERINPLVPAPFPDVDRSPDSDGWNLILRLGGWNSALCRFPMLEECPAQHEEVYLGAWEEVLSRWEAAISDEQENMALMWIMFLQQSLLRKPSRGGRGGRGQVAKRFQCLQRGDWGSLVEMHQEDLVRLEQRRRNPRTRQSESEADLKARVSREAAALISKGQTSKAMRRLLSHGVANVEDPNVLNEL